MEILNYFRLITALTTLFFVFVEQSEAFLFIDANEFNGYTSSFQKDLDDFDRKAAIGGEGNIVIELGKAAVDIINNDAEACKKAGGHPKAVDVLADGLTSTIKLIAENGGDAFDLIDQYKGNAVSDPEAAIDNIDRGIRVVKRNIYHSGVPCLSAFGAVGIIAPNVTKSKLRYCLEPTQDSGTAIFNCLDSSQVLATRALKSPKQSKDKSLKAAHSAIVAGASSLNSSLVKAAKRAFAYLIDVATGKVSEVQESGDVLSARAKALARDSETLAMIDQIDLKIQNGLSEGLPKTVLKEIREGVMADIETSAAGILAASKCLEKARIMAKNDTSKALEIIKLGFDAARKGCIDGSVQAYQGFGAAAHLVGQKVFSSAIEKIENSRIDSTDEIEASRKLANMGIISGDVSTNYGLSAADDALEATEVELFTKISSAVEYAMTVLKAKTKWPGLI